MQPLGQTATDLRKRGLHGIGGVRANDPNRPVVQARGGPRLPGIIKQHEGRSPHRAD